MTPRHSWGLGFGQCDRNRRIDSGNCVLENHVLLFVTNENDNIIIKSIDDTTHLETVYQKYGNRSSFAASLIENELAILFIAHLYPLLCSLQEPFCSPESPSTGLGWLQ